MYKIKTKYTQLKHKIYTPPEWQQFKHNLNTTYFIYNLNTSITHYFYNLHTIYTQLSHNLYTSRRYISQLTGIDGIPTSIDGIPTSINGIPTSIE